MILDQCLRSVSEMNMLLAVLSLLARRTQSYELCMSSGTGEDMAVLNIEDAGQSGIVKSQA